MTTGSLTVRSGCKACGAQPSTTATTQTTWCAACGACFKCGEPSIAGMVTTHACPGGTSAVHDLGHLILASGPIRPHIPCPHGAYSRTSCMTCNREDGRLGRSGVFTATHVDGREAPSQAAVDDLVRAHADRGSKVNVHDIVPRETGGREAPPSRTDLLAAARESARNLACRNHGDDATRGDVARGVAAGYVTVIELVTEFALELSANVRPFAAAPSDPDAATVEACARAACEAHPSDPEWAISTEGEREMWRKVARTVLAAAGRGVR